MSRTRGGALAYVCSPRTDRVLTVCRSCAPLLCVPGGGAAAVPQGTNFTAVGDTQVSLARSRREGACPSYLCLFLAPPHDCSLPLLGECQGQTHTALSSGAVAPSEWGSNRGRFVQSWGRHTLSKTSPAAGLPHACFSTPPFRAPTQKVLR